MSVKISCPEVQFISDKFSDLIVCFEQDVLDHFQKHRQIAPSAKETGGQLFGKIESGMIHICSATGPRIIDFRGRSFFNPSRWMERREIKSKFKQGLHYLGDWHTHPQKRPEPSTLDIKSMKECFTESCHELSFFILVIVGQVGIPGGLWVSIHNEKQWFELFYDGGKIGKRK